MLDIIPSSITIFFSVIVLCIFLACIPTNTLFIECMIGCTCCRLVPTLVDLMGSVFPELKQHEKHIKDIIAAEEISFGRTLLKVGKKIACEFAVDMFA